MENKFVIHQLRAIVGYALIGSVLTGALFGWVPAGFDLRLAGAGIGLLIGTAVQLRT